MGGAVIAILISVIVLFFVALELFQKLRRNMRENEATRKINEQKAGEPERVKANQRRIYELYAKEVSAREQCRAKNPVIDITEYINDLTTVTTLTGLSQETAMSEFYKKYKQSNVYYYAPNAAEEQVLNFSTSKRNPQNHEFVENTFHVKGKVVDKIFGLVEETIWLSSDEHSENFKLKGYSSGIFSGKAWEIIVEIENGKHASILIQFHETESDEAKKKSAVFENLSIGSTIEATGILSIANKREKYKVGSHKKIGSLTYVYNTDLLTVRAPFSAIAIHD